jgi:hypothetical protein
MNFNRNELLMIDALIAYYSTNQNLSYRYLNLRDKIRNALYPPNQEQQQGENHRSESNKD